MLKIVCKSLITACLLFAFILIPHVALADTVYSTTPQPTDIPGNWFIGSINLPTESSIISSTQHNPNLAGLYAWGSSYSGWSTDAYNVGWKGLRASGTYTDNYVTKFIENDLDVLATLRIWIGSTKKDRSDYNTDQEFIDAYKNYIADFLNRYGPNGSFFTDNPQLAYKPIKYIELWNEPNFHYMLPNDDNLPRLEIETLREQLYAKVLLAVYPFVKQSWPEVQVAAFAAGGSASADTRFIQHVLEEDPNVINCFDIVSTHPYTRPVPSEANSIRTWGNYSIINNLATIRSTLQQHGRTDVPIRYTEVGWEISKAEGGTYDDDPGEEYLTQELQAAYVTRLYGLAMRLGVERVNIMYVGDADGFNGGFFKNAGRDDPWRLSAYAAQNFINLMPNPKFTGSITDGVDGTWILKFSPDTDAQSQSLSDTIMAWKVQGPQVVQIPCGAGIVTVTDVIGNQQVVATTNQTLEIEIGPLPLYIQPGGFDQPAVASRKIFYNNSSFDNNDYLPNQADDNAIATDKVSLMSGQTATIANYTSYNKGINGIIIDIAQLPGQLTPADFSFKTGNSDTPASWTPLLSSPFIAVRPGEGVALSDRVTLIFPDNSIINTWLEVTVNATANTGLAQQDVFYFGNTPGETGDSVTNAYVNATDRINCRNNPRHFINPAAIDYPYDHNRDGKVNSTDEIIARNNPTDFSNALELITP